MTFDRNLPILIVDDYKTMIQIIRSLLRQLNFCNIDEANNGSVALDMMKATRYGLAISDWNMQPMSGLDLLGQIRSDPALKDTPFVMVTAESKPENIIVAEAAGVNTYIVKPFSVETLKSKLASVLGSF